jgi:mono/diheme cytochrome c family protein
MAHMRCLPLLALLLLTAAALAAQPAPRTATAVVSGEDGASLYKSYCASCHGPAGKGDGTLASSFPMAPPDLTLLARKNDGKFDSAKVARSVDGRDPVKGHGGPDMPVWGDAFKRSRGGYSEKGVQNRIDALVLFLKGLQAPEPPPAK